MPRSRLGVALLVPSPCSAEIDGLRRACGDRQLRRIVPHLTLVPPVNVRGDDLAEALRVVRVAAAATPYETLEIPLGAPTSFRPDSPTLYLPVRAGAQPDPTAALGALRDAVFQGPLQRETEWPFVPHVTLADDADDDRTDAAIAALRDYGADVVVDRVHVLEEQVDPERGRRWVPIADATFRPPAIVGRGGIELELAESSIVEPEAAALVTGTVEVAAGARPLVLTARRQGRVVGVISGWSRDDERTVTTWNVAPDVQRMGIGRQLRLAFDAAPHPERP